MKASINMNDKEFHNFISVTQENICQITALKNGIVLINDTWHNYKTTDTVHVMSATKSVVSLLIGIAVDKGFIKSINQPVLNFFPDYTIKRGEKTIQQVTLRHLLTMTAPYKYRSEPWTKVCSSDDWTVAALDLLGGRAGLTGQFKYSTLGIHILTGIITKTSGLSTVDFANQYLFTPLGIAPRTNYYAETAEEHKAFTMSKKPHGNIWFVDPKGVAAAGYGLCMSAEEMAKIGQMCLERGMYGGGRIVSSEWLAESTEPRIQCDGNFRDMLYGYLWWIIDEKKHIYAAIGNSGNVIYVNSEKAAVVAVAGTFKPTVFDRVDFIQEHVEPLLDASVSS
jgi:CubicO group peptidase (beta-lactamase class C family)